MPFPWLERARVHQLDAGRSFMNVLLYNALRVVLGAPPARGNALRAARVDAVKK